MSRSVDAAFLPYLRKGSIAAAILIALTACGPQGAQSGYDADVSSGYGSDGMAAATSWAEPTPSIYADVENESDLLSNIRQLVTDSLRSGEGYFSADGRELIYQSEQAGDNPFYQIFVLELASGVSRLVSPGVGLTTCAWIHPTQDLVMYSSTHEDPNARAKQAEEIAIRESGIERAYGWDYDRHYDIYIANSDGSDTRNISNAEGYDAEGSYSADGSQILFASNREAYSRTLSLAEQALFEDDSSYFMDLYVMDADGGNVRQLTRSPGYDGGPFFSPDGSKITWRRFNPDGNSAEIWTMDADGSNQRQLTADAMVAWAPYYHPSSEYLIYSSNQLGHANFELFLIDTQGARAPVRVTNTDGTDILPVFSPGGDQLAWSTTRTPDGTSQLHIADWNHTRALELLANSSAH
jgi:Tol biopolymer transport system component